MVMVGHRNRLAGALPGNIEAGWQSQRAPITAT
jgi:hypothetical protein